MVCDLLNRELGLGIITRSLVRFLDRTVCRAMGCFFGCFRDRDDRSRPHIVSSSKSTERAVSRNRLSSLFLDEEKGDYPSNDLESPKIDKGLKDEAKFLKACGTIPETPAEIRKASQKFKQSPPCAGDSETSKFRSWLPNTSIDKFQDKQSDQPPTPIKLFEALERRSDSPENTPISCVSNAANTGRLSMGSTVGSELMSVDKTVKIDIVSTSAYGRNKSVRFECESDASSSKSENGGQNPQKLELLGYQSASKPSPYPTPLKLSDEMQTPGTVFPSNLETLGNGKTRIRSQYVHSVLNPVGNASMLNAMKEEPFSSKQMFSDLKECPEQPENATPELEVGVKQTSFVKESEEEGSLSSWLKPKQYNIDDRYKNFQATSTQKPHFGRTLGDRPIIGMVAAHWNEDESSHISPKWWDGNGIPNSTNKYKEDQKVSWHATPFEERLEKALSDESLISQR
ncbi:protein JASON isoform X2 [Durio zibethinus]|nr:protein JASON isoform X2 [Durio zibethinus]